MIEKSCTDSRGGLILLNPSSKLSLSSPPLSRYEVPDSRAPPELGLISIPGATCGAMNGSDPKTSRSANGAFSIAVRLIWTERSEVAVWTRGACSVTSMTCWALANSSCRLSGMTWLASTTIPDTLTVAKLPALISTVYVPGGTSGKR